MKKIKRYRDINILASQIVGIAIGQVQDVKEVDSRNPHEVALGKLGGLRGGKARALVLTKAQRKKIARNAALAR